LLAQSKANAKGFHMDEIWGWLQSLDPIFAFLVVLPFLVVAAAFLGDFIRRQLHRNRHRQQHATGK